jgi:nucleoside phosphorylase
MPNICLIAAMRAEIPYILKNASGTYRIGDNAIRLVVSGIGPRKARRATQQVCNGALGFLPDLLINSGFCGAAQNGLGIGQLIVADRLTYGDREIQLDDVLVEKIGGILIESEYHVGKLQTFNWPVLSRARVAPDTLAVDMESFAIAHMAAKYQIPAVFIKAVSDIVPERTSMIGLLNLVRSWKVSSKKARTSLNINVDKICADQVLGK